MSITINPDGSATFDTIEEAVAYAKAISGAQTTTVPTKTETTPKTSKATTKKRAKKTAATEEEWDVTVEVKESTIQVAAPRGKDGKAMHYNEFRDTLMPVLKPLGYTFSVKKCMFWAPKNGLQRRENIYRYYAGLDKTSEEKKAFFDARPKDPKLRFLYYRDEAQAYMCAHGISKQAMTVVNGFINKRKVA